MHARRPRVLAPVLALVLAASSSGAETLRLRADSWMPCNGEPSQSPPGYAIEIARAICASHGITLDYQNMPWGDALKAAAAGQIEAVIGANKDEAVGLALPQLCIGLPRVALITAKDSTWRYENVDSLHHVRLGVILDYKYWPTLDAYIARTSEPQIRKFTGDHPLEDAVNELLAGRLDVIAETSTVFAWTAKRDGHPFAAFHIAYLHEGDPVHFAFSPAAGPRYAKLFDDGLRELRRNGGLAQILSRYGLEDWQE